MAQPAPKRLGGTPVPDATVNVTDGVASPASVSIPSEGVVAFVADSYDYELELWDKKNLNKPPVNVYLGSNSTIYLVGDDDANSQNSTCYYNVKSYDSEVGPDDVGTGGGNKIIIGSGLPE